MRSLATCILLTLCVSPAFGQSPIPIKTLAPIQEIELLVNDHVETVTKALADETKFEDQKGKSIRESFGMLAVLGQALAEHEDKATLKLNGPALRDAALEYKYKGTHAEATQALAHVKDVIAGKVTGEHAEFHPWNKLINMHPMMELLNGGNGTLVKVVKRQRGKPEEPLAATTWALLGAAMKADTHEVKNADDLPKWNAWSDEFIDSSVKLAAAIRAKNGDEARKWFDKAGETCDACHEVFHNE